eukprot:7014556-Pyramimonas_sp.AAC.1
MQTPDAVPPPCLRHIQLRRQPWADHNRMVDELRRSWEFGIRPYRASGCSCDDTLARAPSPPSPGSPDA